MSAAKMRCTVVRILLVLVMLPVAGLGVGKDHPGPLIPPPDKDYYRIIRPLGDRMVSWLTTGDESDGEECDRLADSLLSLPEPRVLYHFVSAEVAVLRKQPDKAISILETVIKKHPNDRVPRGPVVPIAVGARFHIATIAKQSGDIARAVRAYESTLKELENLKGLEGRQSLKMLCSIYLAEIESQHLKKNDRALLRLQAVQQAEETDRGLDPVGALYKSWAAYEQTRMSRGPQQAAQGLLWYSEFRVLPIFAVMTLEIVGIAGGPLVSSNRRMQVGTETRLNRTIENSASQIDRSLALLARGFIEEHNEDFAQAERYYAVLFEDNSFLSPLGGVRLAECKKAQGKTAEADTIVQDIRRTYPGYASAFTDTSEDSPKELPPKARQERKIRADLSGALDRWLSDANESAATECDILVDLLVGQEQPELSSYFIAAQVAHLRGRSEAAIALLEDAVLKYPERKAPVISFPVKIVGRFWMATIAKQSGDMATAKDTYEILLDCLEKLKGWEPRQALMMICDLYLFEIESEHLKNKDRALARLDTTQAIETPGAGWGRRYAIYKAWGSYLHASISKDRAQAVQHIVPEQEGFSGWILGHTHLSLVGITTQALAAYCGRDQLACAVGRAGYDRAIQAGSSIDRSLATLMYAHLYEKAANVATAQEYYSHLFEEESFLSPIGGMHLATLMQSEGKTAQAENILEAVKTRYPTYAATVRDVKRRMR